MLKDKLKFVKRNYIVGYSFLLIVVIVGVVFFGNYYTLNKFEYNTDKLLQSKAILAEDIFNVLISDGFSKNNKVDLENKIEKILENDSEIKNIEILMPEKNDGKYKIIVSGNKNNKNKIVDSELARIAFSNDSGIAFLNADETGRYWEVIKAIKNNKGNRIGVISFQMSLAEHDNFIRKSINKIYLVLFLLIGLVLLVVANHVRFFRYALRATKLEEVDKMKDDFISMASHELKSPLTAIRGYTEILKESLKDGKTDDNIQILKNVEVSTLRLNELVVDLLDVSRIQQNRMPIKMEDIKLSKLVRSVIDELTINAKQKNLKIIYNKPKKNIDVFADAKRVKQILINLLSNAIKYTPQGSVEVKIEEEGKTVLITIADTGLGISAENLKNLFSKFYRVKTEKTVGIPGTGLGLWISREIAKKMKGDLTVESIKGVGSHFTLKLKKYKK